MADTTDVTCRGALYGAIATILAVAGGGGAHAAPAAARLDGVWRSRGYDFLIELRGSRVSVFDDDTSQCSIRQRGVPLGDALANPRLTAGGELQANDVGRSARYTFDRLSALPDRCRRPPLRSTDPRVVFDAFWRAFKRSYAFFSERALDWDALRARYRKQISANTSNARLFAVLRRMESATNDLHVRLSAGDRSFIPGLTSFMYRLWGRYDALPQPRPDLGEYLKVQSREQLRPTILRYLDPGSYRTLDSNLSYGTLANGRIAYLQVLGESGFGKPQPGLYRLSAELTAARASLAQAFELIARARALILDVRVNYGGQDAVSMMLAAHLTRHGGVGFTKCARVGDGFGDAQIFRYAPQRPGFFGPTVILTSAQTISAGDEFVMIAKDFPNVITVGDTTAGVYSDPLEKRLPNGWRIGISNERYVAPDGRIYEARGIAPDVRVGFNPEMIVADGSDPGLRKAIDVIDEVSRHPGARILKSPLPPRPAATCGPAATSTGPQ